MRGTIQSLAILCICLNSVMGRTEGSTSLGSKNNTLYHGTVDSTLLETQVISTRNITCYSCLGYSVAERSDEISNSIECTGHAFSSVAIGEQLLHETHPDGETLACVTVTIQDDDWNNGTEWVIRSADKYMDISWSTAARKEYWVKKASKLMPSYRGDEEFDVDFCYTDKCNGAMHTVAASIPVVVVALLSVIRM